MEQPLCKLLPNPEKLHLVYKSGATLTELVEFVPDIINQYNKDPADYHVYFLAGLCDVTFRDIDRHYNHYETYEEVFFNETPQAAIERLSQIIQSVSEQVLEWGAKPCFSTIIPGSLRVWNETRLEQGKTSFLIHHPQYDCMQANMVRAIAAINKIIVSTNNINGMTTPFLATTVMKNMGPRKQPRVHYNKFVDGVHPKPDLLEAWSDKLANAIKENRNKCRLQRRPPTRLASSSSESDTEPPTKRPWRAC